MYARDYKLKHFVHAQDRTERFCRIIILYADLYAVIIHQILFRFLCIKFRKTNKLTNLYTMAHLAGSHKTMHGMNHRYPKLQQFHQVRGPVINCLRIQDALMMYRLSFEILSVLAGTKPAVWLLT